MNSDKYVTTRMWKTTLKKLRELNKLVENSSQVRILDELVTKKHNSVKNSLARKDEK